MKRALIAAIAILLFQPCYSQINITTADMPAAGDTLRYSVASITGMVISPKDSGISVLWKYNLKFAGQGVDTYKTTSQVNPAYLSVIDTAAYGYVVADSLAGAMAFHHIYTFFENSFTLYKATAFAATIAGTPTPASYSIPDEWYHFPLTYLRTDSSDYELNVVIPGVGGLKRTGTRYTRADGWGQLITPYYTTPANCLRVRSVVHGVDSVTFGASVIAIPVNTVEYRWLVNGEHYPALWVTSNITGGAEIITSIRYRDSYRDTTTPPPIDTNVAVHNVTQTPVEIKAFPNPAVAGIVRLAIPAGWKDFLVQVFDLNAKEVAVFNNQRDLDLGNLPAGQYIARISSGIKVAYVQIVK
jgi:hypothetical protein